MPAGRKQSGKKTAARRAASMFKVAEPTREWSERLTAELRSWPDVGIRPMFGMLACYRSRTIFAALPAQRTLYSSSAIAFKLQDPPATTLRRLQEDGRILASGGIGARWYGFQVDSPEDIRDALLWLGLAYESAAVGARPGRRKSR